MPFVCVVCLQFAALLRLRWYFHIFLIQIDVNFYHRENCLATQDEETSRVLTVSGISTNNPTPQVTGVSVLTSADNTSWPVPPPCRPLSGRSWDSGRSRDDRDPCCWPWSCPSRRTCQGWLRGRGSRRGPGGGGLVRDGDMECGGMWHADIERQTKIHNILTNKISWSASKYIIFPNFLRQKVVIGAQIALKSTW